MHLTIRRLQVAVEQANTNLEAQVATRTQELTETVMKLQEQISEREQAEAALQQHAERLRLLHQIDQAILAAQSPVEIAQGALRHLKHLIPCQRASLTIFDYKANEVIIQVLDPDDNTELAIGSRISLKDFEGLGNLQDGMPYIVADVSAHFAQSSSENQLLTNGIESVINVPLIVQEALIGSINLGATAPNAFTTEHLAIAREVAAPLSVAISQAHLYTSESQRRQEAEALSNIAAALNSTLSLEKVLQSILDNIDRVVDYDAAHIMIVDSGLARIVSQQGYSTYRAPQSIIAKKFVVADFPFLNRIIKTRQPLVISDTSMSPDWVDRKDIQWVGSYVGVPICNREEVIGIINLGNVIPDTFTADMTHRLRALADQAAVALDNAHLHESLKERMQLLQETQARLVHSEMMSALGRLVASIAHEINNPMQSVQTCLTLTKEELAGDQRPEKLNRYLSIVESEIDRVTEILHRMGDFYRPVRAGLGLVDLAATLESVLALVNKHLQHNNVTVASHWGAGLPTVEANADQLKQIFLNLILNAIDAMPNGGQINLRIVPDQLTSKDNQQPRPAVRLEISDTGIGLSEETQSRIFEPFFTTKSDGSGLGLSITYLHDYGTSWSYHSDKPGKSRHHIYNYLTS